MLRLLLLSGGGFQGHTLIKELQALKDCEIHVFDCFSDNITKYFAHYYHKCKLYSDPLFEAELIDYVISNKIDVIIPSSGIELYLISSLKETLKIPCKIAVSNKSLIEILSDKEKTYQFLRKNKLPVLDDINTTDLKTRLPVIGKPKSGWGGKDIIIATEEEQIDAIQNLTNYTWQTYLSNYREISIDFAINFDKEFSKPTFRERIRTLGGFATICQSIEDDQLLMIYNNLAKLLSEHGGCGYFNVQVLIQDGSYFISDINPRIGTSSVMSTISGNNLSSFLLNKETIKANLKNNNSIRLVRYLEEKYYPDINLSNTKVIAFDLDDTLIPHKNWIKSKIELLTKENSHIITDPIKFRQIAHILIDEVKVDRLLDELCKYFNIESYKDSLINSYREIIPSLIDTYNDSLAVVEKLKKTYKLALITDNPKRTQQQKIDKLFFKDCFDEIVYSEDLGYKKPNYLAFKALADKLNIDSHEIVMVGDNLYRDIYGAISANYKFAFHIKREDSIYNFQSLDANLFDLPNDKYLQIKTLNELLIYL